MDENKIIILKRRKASFAKQLYIFYRNVKKAERNLHCERDIYYKVKDQYEKIDRELAMEDERFQLINKKKKKLEVDLTVNITPENARRLLEKLGYKLEEE